MSQPHLLIMAAGTGGHIMPGLAVASQMQARGWTVSWLGTRHGMENQLVPAAGIAIDSMAFAGLRGKGLLHSIAGAWRLLAALGYCWKVLRRRQPTVVLGMGGYVCFPGALVARLRGRPLMLMNADAALLLSNQSLRPIAQCIGFGFDGAAAQSVPRSVVTGNPVRQTIAQLPAPAQRFAGRSGALRLLIVGGSLGAQALNTVLPAALKIVQNQQAIRVIHQTGAAQLEAVRAAYQAANIDADVRPFIEDMATELGQCDVMIARAGAITVSELCAAGVASVLVPLVVSTTSHQRGNAQWLAGQNAAIHLPQTDCTAEKLAAILAGLNRTKLLQMAQAARAHGRPNAAAAVADQIESLANMSAA